MKEVRVTSPTDLSDRELAVWRKLVTLPNWSSPFLHPEYVRALARFRPQVEVAVLAHAGEPVAFFPYERHGRTALPLGIKLADFQGVICTSDCDWNTREVMQASQLTSCRFDHLVTENSPFAESIVCLVDSPYLDLSHGYGRYLKAMKDQGSALISQVQRKRRKLEREVGKLEFTWNDTDHSAWDKLLEWKTAQRVRTRTMNILAVPWVRDFLQHMAGINEPGLKGMVSTLRLDGRVIAVHLGMQTESTLHYWFPAYDAEISRYSPGLILLLSIAEHAAARGIRRIDLGKGDDGYKASFANGADPVATAFADAYKLRRLANTYWLRMQSWIKTSRLHSVAQVPKRIIRNWQVQNSMGSS